MPRKDTINDQQMAASYGFALAFMNSDPELKSLFKKAVKNTWDPNMFVARLRATKWFRKHSASVRNAIMQETSDPATYRDNVMKMRAQVDDALGKAYGVHSLPPKQRAAWAETAYRMGWTQEQLLNQMGASINFQKLLKSNKMGGTAAELSRAIDEAASNYGIQVGNAWKAANIKRAMVGNDTEAAIIGRLQDIAANRYTAFADQIRGGKTVREIADPYIQRQADLLEMNPNDVKLFGGNIQKALTYRDKDGNARPMNMHDFERFIRTDRRWQYTNNAKEQVAKVTTQLLSDFGLMA